MRSNRPSRISAILLAIAFDAHIVLAQGDAAGKLPMQVQSLSFSPDGHSLAAGYGQFKGRGQLIVWDLEKRAPKFKREESVAIPSVAFSPNGNSLAMGTISPTGLLLNSASGEVEGELKGHDHHVRNVAFSPDGKLLATGSYDRTIKIRDSSGGEVRHVLKGHQDSLRSIAFSPDGRWLVSGGGTDNTARLWDTHDGSLAQTWNRGGFVPQAAFSPDSKIVAVPSWSGGLAIFDVETGKQQLHFDDVGGAHWAAFSPDGKWLVLATNGPQLYVFPWQQQADDRQQSEISQLVATFEEDDYVKREAATARLIELTPVALPQLRTGLSSPSAEVRVRCRGVLTHYQSGEKARKLTGHNSNVDCLAFSADGKLLASGDKQGAIILWQVADWHELATLLPAAKED